MITMAYGDLSDLENLCRRAEIEELAPSTEPSYEGLMFFADQELYAVDELEDLAFQLGIGYGMIDVFSEDDPYMRIGRRSAIVDFS